MEYEILYEDGSRTNLHTVYETNPLRREILRTSQKRRKKKIL